jgi:hypothetical protein
VANVVDYDRVLEVLLGQGLKSLYHNSGAFGFPPGVKTHTVGWIGPPDSTIRPEARQFTRQIQAPYGKTLSELALRVWQGVVPGAVWAMPRSHWAYELDFGSRDWLPGVLGGVGVDPAGLTSLSTGAAIEFLPEGGNEFGSFLAHLLDNLSGSSDFQLAWPGRPLLCTVHHHKQLWWTTPDEELFRRIDGLV